MPTIDELNQEASGDIVRSQLRKIVEIYDDEWRVIHELLQNALDAIQNDSRIEDGGLVEVTLDVDNDIVAVNDNGTGFTPDLNLLTPGGTGAEKEISSRSPSKGYQGVGLKAVMYSTSNFLLDSQTSDVKWQFTCEGLREYIDPSSHANPTYDLTEEPASGEGTYTEVIAHFPDGLVGSVLNQIEARHLDKDSEKWKELFRREEEEDPQLAAERYVGHFLGWYFRTHSYAGCYNALLGVPLNSPDSSAPEDIKQIQIDVAIESDDEYRQLDGRLGDWLRRAEGTSQTISFPYKAWDYAQVALENDRREDRYRISPPVESRKPSDDDWEEFRPTFRNKLLAVRLRPDEDAKEFEDKYADYISILERPRSAVSADDYRDLFPKITGIYMVVGRTAYFETLGVENRGQRMIASNGTPTAHDIAVRTTSSTWYLETIHLIVNLDATLNVGKRHLANTRLVGRVNDFISDCYPRLLSISRLFVEREERVDPNQEMPNVIELPRLSRRGVPFRRFPTDESALVAIFTAAVSELQPEMSVYGFFGKAVYDGKFLWSRREVKSDSDLKLLEFKMDIDDLAKEFEQATHDKEFRDISLVVVWDRDISYPRWDVKGISARRRGRLEELGVPTDFVSYILEDPNGDYKPLICVADLLRDLDVVDEDADELEDYIDSLH